MAVEKSVLAYLDTAADAGHTHYHVFLNRSKAYNPNGRFQTEAEAKAIDKELDDLLKGLSDSI